MTSLAISGIAMAAWLLGIGFGLWIGNIIEGRAIRRHAAELAAREVER